MSVFSRTGNDLLSRGLSRSTIGAGGFNGRVRNGIGWNSPASITGPAKDRRHTTPKDLIDLAFGFGPKAVFILAY